MTFFGLAPDTYATAASLVDRMLATIVIKPEHADLVGMACLRIAARLDEPEDIQPTLRELHINCGQAFSEADIERMEKIVDKKLCGPFPIIAFDFINPMLELCADCDCGVCALVCTHAFEKTMIHSVLACYACYELQSFRSSTLALAMLIYRVREKLPDLGADAFVHVATRMREAMSIQEWEIEHCVSCISRNESCAR